MRGKSGLTVGVVGATGMVGQELLDQLQRRRFPVGRLLPFSSGLKRKSVRFNGRSIAAPGIDREALAGCDLVFFVSSDEVSELLAPALAGRGVWCIDDSAAFRLHPRVPLVIPEVNASALRADAKLIAGPNCTMTGVAVAGYPLHKVLGVVEARIASYQAVSGAGKAALQEFFSQHRATSGRLGSGEGRAPVLAIGKSAVLPATISCNVIPQVGKFDAAGSSSEENKVANELRKVWGAPSLRVSVTAVRVPVVRGHALSAWLRCRRPVTPAKARQWLRGAPGLELSQDGQYPTPLAAGGRGPVYAGRLRQGVDARELCLWIVSDNLLKGAALNSVQIAEVLLKRRWLKK
jgi:aspartate-semialdehyde dehydrogenase